MSAVPLWTSDAMASAMRAATSGALPQGISGISIDSRTVGPGEAYFAIKGAVHDGHDFVDAALKAGAGLAVVEKAARRVLAAVAEGDMLRTQLAILRRLLKHTPQNTIALSRMVAQRQLDAGGYKL